MHYQISKKTNYFVQELKPQNESDVIQAWTKIKPGSKIVGNDGEIVIVINTGILNKYDGPDFLNAILIIDGQIKMGSIECHFDASDWDRHGHQYNKSYNNVILHVVNRISKTRKNPAIPTVKLSVNSYNYKNCILSHDISRNFAMERLKYFSNQRWKSKVEEFTGIHNNSNALIPKLIQNSFLILGASANKDNFLQLALNIDGRKTAKLSITELENYLIYLSKMLSINWNRKGVRPAHQPIRRMKLAAELVKYYQLNYYPNHLNISSLIQKFYLLCPSARGKGIQTEIIGNIILPYCASNALFLKDYPEYNKYHDEWQNLKIPEPYQKYSRKFGHVINKSDLIYFWVLQGAIQVDKCWCEKELCDICPLKISYDNC